MEKVNGFVESSSVTNLRPREVVNKVEPSRKGGVKPTDWGEKGCNISILSSVIDFQDILTEDELSAPSPLASRPLEGGSRRSVAD